MIQNLSTLTFVFAMFCTIIETVKELKLIGLHILKKKILKNEILTGNEFFKKRLKKVSYLYR